MKLRKKIALLGALLILVLVIAYSGSADFGGYSGDSDYGSSSSDSWSSSSSDSWSGSYSSSSYDSGGSGGGNGFTTTLVILVFVAYAVYYVMKKTRGGEGPSDERPTPAPTPAPALRPASELRKIDPNFDPDALAEKISGLYVRFQKAWQNKDLGVVRPYLSQTYYAQVNKQLQDDYVDMGLTSYLEKIAVLEVRILGYSDSPTHDIITAFLRTRFVNYTKNDATGAVVRGHLTQEVFMEYEWTLSRKKGVLTQPNGAAKSENCPNCGAVIDLARSAKCEYCGTVLDTAENDWVVSAIKGLSQRGRQ